MKKKQETDSVVRYQPELKTGLSAKQVEERKESGLVNVTKNPNEKSIGRILVDNFFPFFNVVLYVIALVFLLFQIYLTKEGNQEILDRFFGISKYFFLIPLLTNSIIATIEELQARHTLRKIRLVNETKAHVLRQGKEEVIPSHEIVLDDLLLLKAGDQAMVDLVVLEGECEVDESMLTGESDPVKKHAGDMILSGSILLSGSVKARADKVGKDTYASSLSDKVVSFKNHESQLMKDIYQILNVLSVVLFIVLAIVIATLAYKVWRWGSDSSVFDGVTMSLNDGGSWARISLTAGAFSIGIIPTGLVLTTSVTLAVSVVRLARQHTLIQGLYSLENLSRVDTLCLDKTGTLTDGTLQLVETKGFVAEEDWKKKIKFFNGALGVSNPTSEALFNAFGSEEAENVEKILPFSSKTKSSAVLFKDGKKLTLGAPEYLLDKDDTRLSFVSEKAEEGYRVLAFEEDEELLAFFVLEDHIRPSAKDTISYFYENHVDIKIISGDNPLTVSKIASTCGVKDAEKAISLEGISLEKIPELASEYTIFARVDPEQKKALVEALQAKGHKVGMTGDGVNDILALRKADASISFAKATDAAKSCADVVLLDNDFSHLKAVVGQGRRVVNNIERSAILFLMKTFAIILLSLFLIPFKKGQMWYSVENVYLLQTSVIAVGGFLLSLEGTNQPIRGSFRAQVISKAFFSSLFVLVGALIPVILYTISYRTGTNFLSNENTRSLISILTCFAGITACFYLCLPFTRYRRFVFLAVVLVALLCALASPRSYVGGQPTDLSHFTDNGGFFQSTFMHEFFQPWNAEVYQSLFAQPASYITMIVYLAVSIPLYTFLMKKNEKWLSKGIQKKS